LFGSIVSLENTSLGETSPHRYLSNWDRNYIIKSISSLNNLIRYSVI